MGVRIDGQNIVRFSCDHPGCRKETSWRDRNPTSPFPYWKKVLGNRKNVSSRFFLFGRGWTSGVLVFCSEHRDAGEERAAWENWQSNPQSKRRDVYG